MKDLQALPLDPIFIRLAEFEADKNPRKINLGIGVYADNYGNPYVMPSVVNSAKNLDCSNFNYTGMLGDLEFLKLTQEFVLGEFSQEIAQVQTVGGTHACQIYGEIMQKKGVENYILPVPTWDNYRGLFPAKKFIEFQHLTESGEINMQKYREILSAASAEDVFVLQGGQPHNQTGKNISLEQLREIIPILNKNSVQVLVDAAYIGLGLEISRDLEFVRTAFLEINNVALAVSFSKNACLYRHRCGALFLKTDSMKSRDPLSGNYLGQEKIIIESHLQAAIGKSISNAPAFGAMVMKDILKNNSQEWLQELDKMRLALDERRNFLLNSVDGKLDYLQNCRGMFGVLQISTEQITELREKYAIYVLDSGRINFAGISETNREYLAKSLREVL